MTESLLAWFVTVVSILTAAKVAPSIVRAVAPAVRPLGPPLALFFRHLRLPMLCVITLSVAIALAVVAGATYGYLLADTPRTCAMVPAAGGALIPTCEIGHPYHAQLQGFQP